MDSSLIEKFWSKVNIKTPAECWDWIGCLHQSGCGDFRYKTIRERAHRMSWQLTYEVKPSLFILHKCDNRKCVKVWRV